MKPGSVIVDLAAEMGGNCELTSPGETVVRDGVTIHGEVNWPSTVSIHASQLYSRNVGSLVGLLVKDGALALDMNDEIIKGALITYQGEVVHEATKKAMGQA
jgi:NAD(P) transhydrogenase subunit alpha